MIQKHSFKVPIYGSRVYLCVGINADEFIAWVTNKRIRLTNDDKKTLNQMLNDRNNQAAMISFEAGGRFLIWLKKWEDKPLPIQSLVHEITHLCFHLFEYINADVTNSSQEPICYLHDYLTGKCLTLLSKSKPA